MNISVFRISYHRITVDADGKEVGRTSPTTYDVAAETREKAIAYLPPTGIEGQSNIVLNVQTLVHDVPFAFGKATQEETASPSIRRGPLSRAQEKASEQTA